MLPLLYKSGRRPSPSSMKYIGRLTKCEECIVNEELNGNYSISAAFLPTDDLFLEIQSQRFIMAKPNPFDEPQFFEIFECNYDESGRLAVKGRHLKHCGYNNVIITDIMSEAFEDTPQNHWDFCTDITNRSLAFANNFTFASDITENISMEIGYTKSDTIGKFLEEMAEASGGEFHFDNFNILLKTSRGENKPFVLRWNKNIGEPNLSLSAEELYTHVIAVANFTTRYKSGDTYVEFPIQLSSKRPEQIRGKTSKLDRVYIYDATEDLKNDYKPVWDFNPNVAVTPDDYEKIKNILGQYAVKFARSDGGSKELPLSENVNLTVNYQPALEDMKQVGMGDTVTVMLKNDYVVSAKITSTSFDSLSERWKSIELGEKKLKLADIITRRR